VDLPIKNCDFPSFFVCLPEGTHEVHRFPMDFLRLLQSQDNQDTRFLHSVHPWAFWSCSTSGDAHVFGNWALFFWGGWWFPTIYIYMCVCVCIYIYIVWQDIRVYPIIVDYICAYKCIKHHWNTQNVGSGYARELVNLKVHLVLYPLNWLKWNHHRFCMWKKTPGWNMSLI